MTGKFSAIDVGAQMYRWARDLYPLCRSLTGDGTRQTLQYLANEINGDLNIVEVPTGTKAFDWVVPNEWNIRDAYVADSAGRRIIDFQKHNLHIVNYSEPVDRLVDLNELQQHLHSLPDQPDAIPYVTSYYKRNWGFCLPHSEREKLKPGQYRVVVDSTLEPGSLSYGEIIIPGQDSTEILLSTYICHPSMANNELSGPVVTSMLVNWIASTMRRHTYRIVFVPETIGSIVYLSRNLDRMKENTIAGFVINCVGDDRAYSYLPSRLGGTLADRVATQVLAYHAADFIRYSFLTRGSDERQYCSPGIDLPVASIMRTKYACYPEYHTSKDDLSLISPAGLAGGFTALRKCLEVLEHNRIYRTTTLGEPHRAKWPFFDQFKSYEGPWQGRAIMNLISYADGKRDLLGIAECAELDPHGCIPFIEQMLSAGLLAAD